MVGKYCYDCVTDRRMVKWKTKYKTPIDSLTKVTNTLQTQSLADMNHVAYWWNYYMVGYGLLLVCRTDVSAHLRRPSSVLETIGMVSASSPQCIPIQTTEKAHLNKLFKPA